MHFALVDRVVEVDDERIIALKAVSSAEEYLRDHFPTFPVLPGVLMIETLVQAARALVEHRRASRGDVEGDRFVLGEVRALKFASFIRPGQTLRVEVSLVSRDDDGSYRFKGSGRRVSADSKEDDGPTTVSGRFSLRPVRLPPPTNALSGTPGGDPTG